MGYQWALTSQDLRPGLYRRVRHALRARPPLRLVHLLPLDIPGRSVHCARIAVGCGRVVLLQTAPLPACRLMPPCVQCWVRAAWRGDLGPERGGGGGRGTGQQGGRPAAVPSRCSPRVFVWVWVWVWARVFSCVCFVHVHGCIRCCGDAGVLRAAVQVCARVQRPHLRPVAYATTTVWHATPRPPACRLLSTPVIPHTSSHPRHPAMRPPRNRTRPSPTTTPPLAPGRTRSPR